VALRPAFCLGKAVLSWHSTHLHPDEEQYTTKQFQVPSDKPGFPGPVDATDCRRLPQLCCTPREKIFCAYYANRNGNRKNTLNAVHSTSPTVHYNHRPQLQTFCHVNHPPDRRPPTSPKQATNSLSRRSRTSRQTHISCPLPISLHATYSVAADRAARLASESASSLISRGMRQNSILTRYFRSCSLIMESNRRNKSRFEGEEPRAVRQLFS